MPGRNTVLPIKAAVVGVLLISAVALLWATAPMMRQHPGVRHQQSNRRVNTITQKLDCGQVAAPKGAIAISLSADGKYLAIDTSAPGSPDRMEIWDIKSDPQKAHRLWVFPRYPLYGMKWHPKRELLMVSTETSGLCMMNAKTGKERYIIGAYPSYGVVWFGDSDYVIASIKPAGEKPGVPSIIDVRTGQDKPFTAPWHDYNESKYNGISDELLSKDLDAAVVYYTKGFSSDIQLFPTTPGKKSWRPGSVIPSEVDSSGNVTAHPIPLSWLADGRFTYAMVTADGKAHQGKAVEIWTCRRDGSDRKRWMKLPGAEPPSNSIGPQWVSVSANGKRVAFFRKDKLFVYDTVDLVDTAKQVRGNRIEEFRIRNSIRRPHQQYLS